MVGCGNGIEDNVDLGKEIKLAENVIQLPKPRCHLSLEQAGQYIVIKKGSNSQQV